jgi:hypothetical protein
MAYKERGSCPPHFDGKNYQMWSKQMTAFLRGKGQILWDVTVDTTYAPPMNFLAPGSRDMFNANNKAVDYLFRDVSIRIRSGAYGELGLYNLVCVEESSCRKCSGSGSDVCDLPERVKELHSSP